MPMQHPCKRAKTQWLLRNLIVLVVLTGITLLVLALCAAEASFPIIAAIAGTQWLLLAVLLLLWPALTYKHYHYGYDDKRLVLRHGVIFQHQITAPLCQIQDLHFYEGPIMRLFGLGKIIVSTGGSNFEIIGLDKNDAQTIIDEIEARLRTRIEEQHDETI